MARSLWMGLTHANLNATSPAARRWIAVARELDRFTMEVGMKAFRIVSRPCRGRAIPASDSSRPTTSRSRSQDASVRSGSSRSRCPAGRPCCWWPWCSRSPPPRSGPAGARWQDRVGCISGGRRSCSGRVARRRAGLAGPHVRASRAACPLHSHLQGPADLHRGRYRPAAEFGLRPPPHRLGTAQGPDPRRSRAARWAS